MFVREVIRTAAYSETAQANCIESEDLLVNIQNMGHHRSNSETPLKWRFAGGSMVARHDIHRSQRNERIDPKHVRSELEAYDPSKNGKIRNKECVIVENNNLTTLKQKIHKSDKEIKHGNCWTLTKPKLNKMKQKRALYANTHH